MSELMQLSLPAGGVDLSEMRWGDTEDILGSMREIWEKIESQGLNADEVVIAGLVILNQWMDSNDLVADDGNPLSRANIMGMKGEHVIFNVRGDRKHFDVIVNVDVEGGKFVFMDVDSKGDEFLYSLDERWSSIGGVKVEIEREPGFNEVGYPELEMWQGKIPKVGIARVDVNRWIWNTFMTVVESGEVEQVGLNYGNYQGEVFKHRPVG